MTMVEVDCLFISIVSCVASRSGRMFFSVNSTGCGGGNILSAVGDELVIAHRTERLPSYEVAVVAAGPAVYLLAHTLFGYTITGSVSKRKLFGTLACVVVGFVGLFVPALVLAGLLTVVPVAVIGSDYLVASRRKADGEASPHEKLETETSSEWSVNRRIAINFHSPDPIGSGPGLEYPRRPLSGNPVNKWQFPLLNASPLGMI